MRMHMRGALIVFVGCLLIPISFSYGQDVEAADPNAPDPNAPDAAPRVDGERIKSYIEWMARDELEGRKTFTQGYGKAAEWAAANFKKWGLEPAGDDGTYFQDVPIERPVTHRAGMPDLKVGSRQFLLEEEDFSVHDSSTAATAVHTEVVFVGYGISVPDQGLDEYADVNVAGKIVLVLKGSPHEVLDDDDDSGQAESSDPWADVVSDEAKIKTAYEQGAGAVLLHDLRPADGHGWHRGGRRRTGRRGRAGRCGR